MKKIGSSIAVVIMAFIFFLGSLADTKSRAQETPINIKKYQVPQGFQFTNPEPSPPVPDKPEHQVHELLVKYKDKDLSRPAMNAYLRWKGFKKVNNRRDQQAILKPQEEKMKLLGRQLGEKWKGK